MDYFHDDFTTFLGLLSVSYLGYMEEQKPLWFHLKYLQLGSKDEQKS